MQARLLQRLDLLARVDMQERAETGAHTARLVAMALVPTVVAVLAALLARPSR